ncbi:ABC transporter B member 26, chloroplastic [Turnera subulata]|uniref:ABC transporter B member 26, chloroplastic n=1 Tax=Turnera subulata TaxID=218843 RepID=A0A9Q0F458_9ROSI|nr:ABC transporter B member 26, chloroplastic [Turnera subulata]
MALLLCYTAQPRFLSSLHYHQQQKQHNNIRRRKILSLSNSDIRFNLRNLSSNNSRPRLHPIKYSSSNGCAVDSNIERYDEEERYEGEEGGGKTEFQGRIRGFFEFLPSILPGGSWWSLSDEVEVKMMAKPVTVWRALTRMWQLVARDRWVILAAFSALIVSADSSFLDEPSDRATNASYVCLNFSGIRGGCFSIANMILVKRMRETLYTALLLQDISFFDTQTVGDLTSRLGSDCQQVSQVISKDLNLIFRNVVQGTGALIYLLILSWQLGSFTLLICSILAGVMVIYGVYQKKTAKLIQDFTASANEVAQETFSLMRTVRIYGTENLELERYKVWLEKLVDINVRQSAAYGFWNLSFNTLYHSTQVVAVLFGGMSIMGGHITAEKLTKFILYSEWMIYSTWIDVAEADGTYRVFKCVVSLSFKRNVLDFKQVPVLQHVNLSVNPGEVVAIVGLSGSGKSTLVNLLLRLYEPTSGQILIDGFSLGELDVKWFRERIGYVGQEPKLFRTDISSNIRYGCTRDIKHEDVVWAAKQAYAHDFISSLPNGYETLVDDDLLSGGQKQRIAIARAILRDPNILILDEATSALDAESEHNVKGILRSVRNDSKARRSVIVIAHRLSTIQAADRIVVMDGGQIVEIGSHRELLHQDGLYARLTRKQADAVA